MAALLSWDLDHILPYTLALASDNDSPGVRLYQYLVHDLTHLATAPYNLTAIYSEDVIGTAAFASWSKKRAKLHSAVERILRAGVDGGEFVNFEPALVTEVIVGINLRTEMLYSGSRKPTSQLAEQIATFVLRGLLADPSAVGEVRLRANERQSTTKQNR